MIELALTEPVNSVDDALEDGQESIHNPVLLHSQSRAPRRQHSQFQELTVSHYRYISKSLCKTFLY